MTISRSQTGLMTVSKPSFVLAFLVLVVQIGVAFAFHDKANGKYVWAFGLVFLFVLLMPATFVELDPQARQFILRRRFVFDAPFGFFERREIIPFADIDRFALDYDSETGHAMRIILKSGKSRIINGVSRARLEQIERIVFDRPARI